MDPRDFIDLMNELGGFLEQDDDINDIHSVHRFCTQANNLVEKHDSDIKQYIQMLSQKVHDAEGDAQRTETEEEFAMRMEGAVEEKRKVLGNISNMQQQKHGLEVELLETKKQMRGLKTAHSRYLDTCETEANAKAKLALYANVSRIHWSPSAKDDTVSGFCASDSALTPFDLPVSLSPVEMADQIWGLMEA